MASGIQTFDSSGNITLDTNNQISRVHSTITGIYVSIGATAFYPVSGMSADGTWQAFLDNSSGQAVVTVSSGGVSIYIPNISYATALSNATLIILRTGGTSSSSGYGFSCTNDSGNIQIDQDFSNYAYVGGGSNIPGNTVTTLPSGYNFQNSILLLRPSGIGDIGNLVISSGNTFNIGSNVGFDWLCFAPASSIPVGTSGYGMQVYNSSNQLVFDTNLRYLKFAAQVDVPISSFYSAPSTTLLPGEKMFVLAAGFGLLTIQYVGPAPFPAGAELNKFVSPRLGSTNDYDLYVHTGSFVSSAFPPTNLTFGTSRQYTFFNCIPA